MSDFSKLAEQYIATWNETDPSARRALMVGGMLPRLLDTLLSPGNMHRWFAALVTESLRSVF